MEREREEEEKDVTSVMHHLRWLIEQKSRDSSDISSLAVTSGTTVEIWRFKTSTALSVAAHSQPDLLDTSTPLAAAARRTRWLYSQPGSIDTHPSLFLLWSSSHLPPSWAVLPWLPYPIGSDLGAPLRLGAIFNKSTCSNTPATPAKVIWFLSRFQFAVPPRRTSAVGFPFLLSSFSLGPGVCPWALWFPSQRFSRLPLRGAPDCAFNARHNVAPFVFALGSVFAVAALCAADPWPVRLGCTAVALLRAPPCSSVAPPLRFRYADPEGACASAWPVSQLRHRSAPACHRSLLYLLPFVTLLFLVLGGFRPAVLVVTLPRFSLSPTLSAGLTRRVRSDRELFPATLCFAFSSLGFPSSSRS
ncbi:unnamed protein product [Pleuronectes platessa]|uniref:Uncharacterized protein n=1 Tax=Pleuronectes platessa TaxID=8262 RepID=A0A9N7ZAL2_PLEPL|nr:unnamed protein product [Pleuronectes platessa]